MRIKKPLAKYLASLTVFGMNGILASCIALGSMEIVLARTLIGSLFLMLMLLAARKRTNLFGNLSHTLYLAISGMALGVSWIFLYEAYRQVGVGTASLLYYCGPVIVMVLAPFIFREKLTWPKIAGFLAVAAGMLCVNGQALHEGKTAWGLLCGFLSAVLYAVMVIFSKKAQSITGAGNALGQLTAAFLSVAVFALITKGFSFQAKAADLLPILILGIVNTGIGCYFYFSSISKLPVQTVAICGYLEPLSAVLFSMLFLHERMTGYQLLGAALILGGAAFGEMVPQLRKSKAITAAQ